MPYFAFEVAESNDLTAAVFVEAADMFKALDVVFTKYVKEDGTTPSLADIRAVNVLSGDPVLRQHTYPLSHSDTMTLLMEATGVVRELQSVCKSVPELNNSKYDYTGRRVNELLSKVAQLGL